MWQVAHNHWCSATGTKNMNHWLAATDLAIGFGALRVVATWVSVVYIYPHKFGCVCKFGTLISSVVHMRVHRRWDCAKTGHWRCSTWKLVSLLCFVWKNLVSTCASICGLKHSCGIWEYWSLRVCFFGKFVRVMRCKERVGRKSGRVFVFLIKMNSFDFLQ